MAWRKTSTFTEVELEFMRVIWDEDEATPEQIQDTLADQGYPLTGGSIRNVLAIMVEKGYLTRKKSGKTFLYKAKVKRDKASQHMVQDLLKRAFDGSESLMVAALLKRSDLKREELDEIERLIEERKNEVG